MFEKEWLPQAIMIGISYHDFWKMNPHIIRFYIEQYKGKRNEEDLKQWQLGQYIVAAISCISPKGKYPKKPMFQIREEKENFTEKEIRMAILTEQNFMAAARKNGRPETIIK